MGIDYREKYVDQFDVLAVRFDRLERNIGDICGNSKTNLGRDDLREFPDFESEEYKDLPDLAGVCAYDYNYWTNHIDLDECKAEGLRVYLIGGQKYDEGEDMDEMVIPDAEVLEVLL